MTAIVKPEHRHLQAAYAAFAWVHTTFEAAMAHPLRSRLVRARAAQLAHEEHRAATRAQRTHRVPCLFGGGEG